jgi:CoA:oxalate CoA-transferase
VAEALDDPQVAARDMIVEAGGVRMLGNPVRVSGFEPAEFRGAPELGADTRQVLGGMGRKSADGDAAPPTS